MALAGNINTDTGSDHTTGQGKRRKPEQDLRDLAQPGDAARMDALFDDIPVEDRKAFFDEIGKDQARILGSRIVAQMLDETELSSREIDAEFGFDHAVLSKMANGKAPSGPTLWKLFALAEALGYDLSLSLTKRA